MKIITILLTIILVTLGSCSKNSANSEPTPPVIPPIVEPVEPTKIDWKSFLSASLKLEKDSLWPNQIGHTFYVNTSELYFGTLTTENLCIGTLINGNIGDKKVIEKIAAGEYNPIELSCFNSGKYLSFTLDSPSESRMDSIVNIIKVEIPLLESSSFLSNTKEYNSRRELYARFAHLNIGVDSLISGKKYYEKEMDKKFGVAQIQIHKLLSVDMEIPAKLLKKDIDKSILGNKYPAYIRYIVLGNIKMLLLESDFEQDKMLKCLNRIAKGESLSVEDEKIMSNSTVYFIEYTSDGIKSLSGNKNLIDRYYDTTYKLDLVPVSCSLSDYNDNQPFQVPLKIQLP